MMTSSEHNHVIKTIFSKVQTSEGAHAPSDTPVSLVNNSFHIHQQVVGDMSQIT